MIERKFVSEKLKEFMIREHVNKRLKHAGQSDIKLKKTPLGEKIVITAAKPGLVVGRKGENIKALTLDLKRVFKLENPQIEIEEVSNQFLDAQIMAEKIAMTMERFGSARFKSIGHRVLTDIMRSGAMGAEILISGKIPSTRAKTWRFYQGYLKKSGSVAHDDIATAYTVANLKTGIVGIQVRIMLPGTPLPDKIEILEKPSLEEVPVVEDTKEEVKLEVSEKDSSDADDVSKESVVEKAEGSSEEKKSPKAKDDSVKEESVSKKADDSEKTSSVEEVESSDSSEQKKE